MLEIAAETDMCELQVDQTLVDTDSSVVVVYSSRSPRLSKRTHSKKRIGPYSYYVNHVIGTGFSSVVYRGIKDNNKAVHYAIKAIKITSIVKNRKLLLESEINILRQISHPNLLRFYDIFYTNNHCYIITEYCEGGNLYKYLYTTYRMSMGKIIHQIGQACKYLAENCIIHRDLKPANIFLTGDTWKVGDFGFARTLPQRNSILIENYIIGSPLYMPLETLESNVYSSKSDSFALGVLIHYILTKQFPWMSKHRSELVRLYKTYKFSGKHILHLKKNLRDIIRKLVSMDTVYRPHIKDIDFYIFLKEKTYKYIEQAVSILKNKYSEQVTLCQYIHYLMMNSSLFLQNINNLFTLMSRHLAHLIRVFEWEHKNCFAGMMSKFLLPEVNEEFGKEDYEDLNKLLVENIVWLQRQPGLGVSIGMEKLLQYYQIVLEILRGSGQYLPKMVAGLALHKDYSNVMPNVGRINDILRKTDLL